MAVSGGGDEPPFDVSAAEHAGIEDAYRLHGWLLREIAEKKFRIPAADAEALVNEIFISYLLRCGAIRDPKRWLIGAVCHASRGYWRMASRTDPLPPDIDDYADPRPNDTEATIVDRITVAAALNRLGPKCRETLRLYYVEGYSANEIAAHLGTSAGYVMQLLHNCRKQVRRIYNELLERQP
ncbi:MAG TPA: sigma-70 family RNA polymerase sigma factor [Thermoanaerobaculia bacterium]|nr:sigma-70 family RNA polymerase sigma factor [Thermoanaerobaculia bacterium]